VPGSAHGASLIADYRFDDSLASSVPGAPPLSPLIPAGSFQTATVDGRPDRVYAFPEGSGVSYPASGLPNPRNYSTVVDFSFDDVSGFNRLLAPRPIDSGLYILDGKLDYYDGTGSGNDNESGVVFSNGAFAQLAFTRAADNVAIGYVGGQRLISQVDPTGQTVVDAGGLRYFKDNGIEDSAGRVARIRVYDGVLSPQDVLAINQTGGLAATAARAGEMRLIKRKGKPKAVATGITVGCPPEGVPCGLSGALKAHVKGKQKRLGTLRSTVGPGASRAVTIKLSKKGRKLIAQRGKLPVEASVSITPSSGTSAMAGASRRL
jgi:hypothetical protein